VDVDHAWSLARGNLDVERPPDRDNNCLVRVIAGRAKGHKLFGPSGYEGTRPILGRAKVALFDILQPRIDGARFLDLFAGVGGVGIEALSRGAAACVFVEQSDAPLHDLRRNLTKTRLDEDAEIVQSDVFAFLSRETRGFDIAFAAPPQWQDLWARVVATVDAHVHVLADNGVLVAHMDPKEYRELPLESLALADQRRYGNVLFCFYERAHRGEA
jgi:16S rRNA (guanine(966)-N(2))-methyltransferase RsmD